MSIFGFPPIEARRGVAHFVQPTPPRGAPPAAWSRPVYRAPAPMYRAPDPGAWRQAQMQHQRANDYYLDRQRNATRLQRLAQQQNTAQAQAAAAAAQQQLLAAQQQLATAQAQIAAQQPAPGAVVTAPPPSPVVSTPIGPSPSPDVSPGNATQDMSATQDAAAAAATPDNAGEHPGHAMGRKVVIALVLGGLAFGGYKFMKSRKGKSGGGGGGKHAPAMHGYRRRRFGRRR